MLFVGIDGIRIFVGIRVGTPETFTPLRVVARVESISVVV